MFNQNYQKYTTRAPNQSLKTIHPRRQTRPVPFRVRQFKPIQKATLKLLDPKPSFDVHCSCSFPLASCLWGSTTQHLYSIQLQILPFLSQGCPHRSLNPQPLLRTIISVYISIVSPPNAPGTRSMGAGFLRYGALGKAMASTFPGL